MSHYRKNRKYNKETKTLNSWLRRTAKKIKCVEYLGGKCEHCGDDNFIHLSFHHIGNKESTIGVMLSRGRRWEELKKELNGCILMCEICHRKLHMSKEITKRQLIKEKLIGLKKVIKCEKCNYNDIRGLDFHHIESEQKEIQLSDVESIDFNSKIIEELDKCQVLCINCHREVHFSKKDFDTYKEKILKLKDNLNEQPPKYDRKEILKLHDGGLNQTEISKRMGCSISVVCEILKTHRNYYSPRIDDEEVLKMYKSGINPFQISKKTGFARTSIVRALKRKGITW